MLRGPFLVWTVELLDVPLSGTNVVSLFQRKDEHSSVSDFSGTRRFDNALDGVVDQFIGKHDLDHDLRQQGYAVLRAAVDGLVTLLSSVAADFGDRHAGDAQPAERILYFFQFVWANNCLN